MSPNIERLAVHVRAQCGVEIIDPASAAPHANLPPELGEVTTLYSTGDFAVCDPPVYLPVGTMQLLPWRKARALWNELSILEDEDAVEFFDETGDDGRVRAVLYDKRRFSIAYDEAATRHLFVDGIPGPKGSNGQIILNSSEATYDWMAASADAFFGHICDLLDEKRLAFGRVPADYGAGFWLVDSAGKPVDAGDLSAAS